MERLQKILAKAGVASRRKAEELIRLGRVTVNGQVVQELGTQANPKTDQITVDRKLIELEPIVNVLLHKPTSYVSTVADPEGRRTVIELLDGVSERVYPVGRLDYDTSGLLLLSNDGELTNRLLHPKHHVNKVYRVTVLGLPEKTTVQNLERGIALEDGTTAPAEVRVLRKHPMESVLEITIHEGRNRQVRRMFEAVGHPVKRLKRIQFGPLEIGDLPPGKWRYLTEKEWKALYAEADIPVRPFTGEVTPSTARKAAKPVDRRPKATKRPSSSRRTKGTTR